MFPVSERFLAEMNKPQRKISIWGTLSMTAIDYSINLYGENIIADSLCITEQFTGGQFCFGSVSSMELTIGIKGLKQNAKQLANSIIQLSVMVDYEDGTTDSMDFPFFYVDGSKIKSSGDVTTLVAYDEMRGIFDKAIETEIPEGSVFDMFEQVILGAGAEFSMTREQIEAFPNGNLTVSIDTAQIQTYRDALMWLCELTNTFVRCGDTDTVQNKNIEIVRMEHRDPESDLLPQNVIEIKGDVRFKTEFSDVYVRPITVLTRRKGKLFTSKKIWRNGDVIHTTVEINNNPLLNKKTDAEFQAALDNIMNDMQHYKGKPFSTTYSGNPAIQCGDYVRLTGGAAQGEREVIGVVTYHKWKFRGKSTIKCQIPAAMGDYVDPASTASTFSARANSLPTPVLPKNQLEKRVDALEGAAAKGGASANYLINSSNGLKVVATWNGLTVMNGDGRCIGEILFNNGKATITSYDINYGIIVNFSVGNEGIEVGNGVWKLNLDGTFSAPTYDDKWHSTNARAYRFGLSETGVPYLEYESTKKRIYFDQD